jgi:glucosamine kinase
LTGLVVGIRVVSIMLPASPRHTRLPRWSASNRHRYWLGVDGGGTQTRLRLADATGRTLAEGRAGPSALGQGADQAWRHIQQALAQAAHAAGLSEAPDWADCAMGAGLSGAGVPAQAQAFLGRTPLALTLTLDTDGHTGVLGAHAAQAGALVIAGTGSVAEALAADGQRRTVGGWGWLNGDEGSGAWLGKAAVRHAQRALDGRDPTGPLARAVWDLTSERPDTLLAWALEAQQQRFASLAPLVFEHENDDPTAQALLADAVQELAALAGAVDPSGQLPIAWSGSIADRLALRLPPALRARSVAPQGDAMSGALLMVQHCLLNEMPA